MSRESVQLQRSPIGLVRAEGALPFAEWLELSWFYPEGFRKQRIIETERSWVVCGEQIVYKFLKVPGTNADPEELFRKRWQLSCEELLDHRELAPELYLGLRLLRWVDEEPQWMSETAAADLNPLRPLPGADDVAIVMRRVPDERLLDRRLESQPEISSRTLQQISQRLSAFQRSAEAAPAKPFDGDPGGYVKHLVASYVRPLEQFMLREGSFLDPFSKLAFEEIRAYLSRFVRENEALLRERVSSGRVVDGHGALRADRICVDSGVITFPGRLGRHSAFRAMDTLADTAALVGDLEARGFPTTARDLEAGLLEDRTEPPALMRFYRAAESVRRAQLLFSGKASDARIAATSYLSVAFRAALALEEPFILVVGGNSPEEELRLARGFDALAMTQTLSIAQLTPGLPEDAALEQLLRMADTLVARGQPVTLLWPSNRDEERLRIAARARRSGAKILFVLVEGRPSDARVEGGRNIRTTPSRWQNGPTLWELPHTIVQPTLAPADLALEVLRQLGRGAR